MPNPAKPIVLGAAFLVGVIIGTNADPLARTGANLAGSVAAVPSGARQLPGRQIATLPPANAAPMRDSIALPGVSVVTPYLRPYTSHLGPKASPNGTLRVEHYPVPADYETNVALHPYSSRIGPPVEGGHNRQGDLQTTTGSHYSR
jgi:hypothetical protein